MSLHTMIEDDAGGLGYGVMVAHGGAAELHRDQAGGDVFSAAHGSCVYPSVLVRFSRRKLKGSVAIFTSSAQVFMNIALSVGNTSMP